MGANRPRARPAPAVRQPLALRAVRAAAAVVAAGGVAAHTVLASRDVPAARRRSAGLDSTHHLHLVDADMPHVGVTPRGNIVAEDVSDLQQRTRHGRQLLRRQPNRVLPSRTPAAITEALQQALDAREQTVGNASIADVSIMT